MSPELACSKGRKGWRRSGGFFGATTSSHATTFNGTFKKSGDDSVASPDFRLSGRNSPSDPASVDLESATVRTLLIQLADFSLDFQSVKDECFVENETDTYTVDRAKVVALFQDVMSVRAQQGGWRLAPTKAEVEQ